MDKRGQLGDGPLLERYRMLGQALDYAKNDPRLVELADRIGVCIGHLGDWPSAAPGRRGHRLAAGAAGPTGPGSAEKTAERVGLFDIDDTLFDYPGSESASVLAHLKEQNLLDRADANATTAVNTGIRVINSLHEFPPALAAQASDLRLE